MFKWGRIYGKYQGYNQQHFWQQALYRKRTQGMARMAAGIDS
jgi:hypothetical protein